MSDDNPYSGLRSMALGQTAETLKLHGLKPGDCFGILMEMGRPKAVVTLACFLTGDTSLYTSNGGGIIGLGPHENVAVATKRFVAMGTSFVPRMREARGFPMPSPGMTVFYLLTGQARYTASASEDDLGRGRSAFSPLFDAAQDVITQIRITAPPR